MLLLESTLSPTDTESETMEEEQRQEEEGAALHNAEEGANRCTVCLEPYKHRTSITPCYHSFCFVCISQWAEVSRSCPHCRQKFIFAVIHGEDEHDEHELHEFPELSQPEKAAYAFRPPTLPSVSERPHRQSRRAVLWGQRAPSPDVVRIIRSEEKRRFIYRHGLRAKHVGSSVNSKCKQFEAAEFRRFPALLRKLEPWIVRDLKAALLVEDVEIIKHVVMDLLTKEDLQSDTGINHLSDFLADKAEHFIHELKCFARSPFNMDVYDTQVQYDPAPGDGRFVPEPLTEPNQTQLLHENDEFSRSPRDRTHLHDEIQNYEGHSEADNDDDVDACALPNSDAVKARSGSHGRSDREHEAVKTDHHHHKTSRSQRKGHHSSTDSDSLHEVRVRIKHSKYKRRDESDRRLSDSEDDARASSSKQHRSRKSVSGVSDKHNDIKRNIGEKLGRNDLYYFSSSEDEERNGSRLKYSRSHKRQRHSSEQDARAEAKGHRRHGAKRASHGRHPSSHGQPGKRREVRTPHRREKDDTHYTVRGTYLSPEREHRNYSRFSTELKAGSDDMVMDQGTQELYNASVFPKNPTRARKHWDLQKNKPYSRIPKCDTSKHVHFSKFADVFEIPSRDVFVKIPSLGSSTTRSKGNKSQSSHEIITVTGGEPVPSPLLPRLSHISYDAALCKQKIAQKRHDLEVAKMLAANDRMNAGTQKIGRQNAGTESLLEQKALVKTQRQALNGSAADAPLAAAAAVVSTSSTSLGPLSGINREALLRKMAVATLAKAKAGKAGANNGGPNGGG
ncbi:uncharacterized protein EV422DRAFT_548468 [Fimicolochytrium jonesii]|uniref:uncharacterized protein n=1 Tax=Fimicolochytrium jonesii TaxID=1396493 RepID=UPI0022FE7944|nr:uncharacterized protein EV422DRAFT_548468 [Fimicolochytrium jonesii]KAI8815705.1 hypothetical protein EV422DRAFT_548468 [Fimicolochytrium jonesii]